MDIRVNYRPSYSMATVSLAPGESFRAESGAMVGMSTSLRMETSSRAGKGGVLKGLARKMLTGESFFLNTFHADSGPGEVHLSPSNVGDLVVHQNTGELLIQSTCYVASDPSIDIQTKVAGFKNWFGGKGFFMLKAVGTGPVLLGAFGAIEEVEVTEDFIVDTGHIVAFEPTLDYSIRRVGGWFSTFFSGEGFVCRFTGRGKLWIQTRNPGEFGSLIGPKLPPR
jgi:uncharacterized protein (TIGR00266 family)